MAFSGEHRSSASRPSPAWHTHPSHSRSISCSKPFLNEGRPEVETNNENGLQRTVRRKKSVTFDDCLSSEEVRKQLGLTDHRESRDILGIYQEPAQGEFRGHRQRHVSGNDRSADQVKLPKYLPTLETIASVPPTPGGKSPIRVVFQGRDNKRSQDIPGPELDAAESHSGTVRRRRRMRTVSKEDYLMVRGANPRTGRVTPGSHSASSSFEGEKPLKSSGSSVGAKWRQNGDQWIRLAADQATPQEPALTRRRQPRPDYHLKTPPKLAACRPYHSSVQRAGHVSHNKQRVPDMTTQLSIEVVGSLPGSYPLTPQKDILFPPHSESRIKRKPVGISDGAVKKGDRVSGNENPPGAATMQPFAQEQLRSSSAPTPRKQEYFSPDDVGNDDSKELPPLPRKPREDSTTRIQSQLTEHDPFLGQRLRSSSWIEDVPPSMAGKCQSVQKLLPDLPTNNGPYQYRQKRTGHPLVVPQAMHGESLPGPRGGDQTYPYVRVPRSRNLVNYRYGSLNQETGAINSTSSRVGHPRGMTLDIGAQRLLHGPRMMTPIRNLRRVPTEGDVVTTAPDTTSMSIGTSTHTRIPTNHKQHPGSNRNDSGLVEAPIQATQTTANYHKMSPLSGLIDQRGGFRPRMPNRIDATHQIPKIGFQGAEETGIGNRHQWRMIGMSHNADAKKNDEQEGCQASHIGIMPDQPINTASMRQKRLDKVDTEVVPEKDTPIEITILRFDARADEMPVESAQRNGLTRGCSRCHNGFVRNQNGGTRGMDGLTPTSGDRLTTRHLQEALGDARTITTDLVTELSQITTTSSTHANGILRRPQTPEVPLDQIVEIYADGRDHAACCPECCDMEDCHDGCLGHPSPVPSPARTVTSEGENSVESGTTAVDDSSIEARSTLDKIWNPRVTFSKQTFRKHLGKEHPKKSPLPSPTTFWGGDGTGGKTTGAVAAAKKALNPSPQPRTVDGASEAAKKAVGLPKDAELDIRKPRARPRNVTDPATPGPAGANQGNRLASGTQANDATAQSRSARRALSGSDDSSADATYSKSRHRNVSGSSLRSIDFPPFSLPFVNAGEESLAVLCEFIVLPLRVGWMWVQQHPELKDYVWIAAEKALGMLRVISATVEKCWVVAEVYSRTGKVRLRRQSHDGGLPALLFDVGRSLAYIGVFLLAFVLFGRVFGGFWWVIRSLGWFVQGFVWLVGRVVLGYG